jgi:hypothetical protein
MRSPRPLSLAVLSAATLTLASCSNRPATSTETTPATFTLTAHGSIRGGQQPISGALVQLYAAGSGGDGTAATPLILTTVTSDANGNFSITGTYTCPTTGSGLVYLVGSGGNAGSGNNPNLTLMTALGACGSIGSNTYLVVNEVTTVAAIAALSPFMSGPANLASGTTDASFLAAAFTTAAEYANIATGISPGANLPAGITIPVAEIDTLANIAAACVNSTGGTATDTTTNCGALFSAATPAGSSAPTDVVTALLNVENNPGMNAAALYALTSSTAPFQPQLASAPADYNIRPQNSGGTGAPTPTVTLSPTTLTFYFASVAQTITMSNYGATAVSITSFNLSSTNWSQTNNCGSSLPAQSLCTINVQSTTNTVGTFTGTLTVVDSDTADDQVVQLTTIDYPTEYYGNSVVGEETGFQLGLLFAPPAQTLTFNSLTGPATADFSLNINGFTGPASLPLNSVCAQKNTGLNCSTFTFFKPGGLGIRYALLNTSQGTYLLLGKGIPHGPYLDGESGLYNPNPGCSGSVSFTCTAGSVVVGGIATLDLTFFNSGDASLTFNPTTLTGSGDFTLSTSTAPIAGDIPPCGSVLKSGASNTCYVGVLFSPSGTGSRTATLTVSDTAGDSNTYIISGTGQ